MFGAAEPHHPEGVQKALGFLGVGSQKKNLAGVQQKGGGVSKESGKSPGGIQVLRMEIRRTVRGALARHVLGQHVHEVHEAKDGEKLDISVLVDNVNEAAAYADLLAPNGGKGKPARCVEFVIAGCRSDWTRKQEDAYFGAAFSWLIECAGPHSMVAAAAIHRHETAPHMQALIVLAGETNARELARKTTNEDGKTRYHYRSTNRKVVRLGWRSVRDRFSPGKGRASDRMSRMQDYFHREVAGPHGLERGTVGSEAVHEPIDRKMAADAKAEEAERKAAEAAERALEASRQADAAQERADSTAAEADTQQERLVETRTERLAEDDLRHEARLMAAEEQTRLDTIREEAEKAKRGKIGRRSKEWRDHVRKTKTAETARAEETTKRKDESERAAALEKERDEARSALETERESFRKLEAGHEQAIRDIRSGFEKERKRSADETKELRRRAEEAEAEKERVVAHAEQFERQLKATRENDILGAANRIWGGLRRAAERFLPSEWRDRVGNFLAVAERWINAGEPKRWPPEHEVSRDPSVYDAGRTSSGRGFGC